MEKQGMIHMLRKGIIVLVLLTMAGYAAYHQFAKQEKIEATKTKTEQTAEEVFANSGLEIGKEAPDFELQTTDGKKMKLSDLKGKKVILNFWATWCPPCKKEMPDLQAFYEKNKQDVVLLAVNYTVSERTSGQEKVRTFAAENGLTFPILYDTTSAVSNTYKIITIPTSYFIDTKGVIRQKHIGPMTEAFMQKTVKGLK
jgi:peroxiredoxin